MVHTLILNSNSILSRPIQIIDDKSYFTTSITVRDETNTIKSSWVTASGDFIERYSEASLDGHKRYAEAPFLFELDGSPRPGTLLSPAAYKRYVIDGEAIPDAADLFAKVSNAIDSFVSFEGGSASQKEMSDFLACWVFGTYATPCFDTLGYIWPSGERGSGKTQTLKTIMAMSFMGQTATAGSSFASIRDEAALGATIGFDDCENIRKMESDKRELLLAGNTKGAGFMHKEPGKREGSWNTKYVDCFAPRGFTSIGLPDEVLGSRTVMIHLTKTGDAAKTRRKPTNLKDWEIAPADLRDAIWLNVARDLVDIDLAKEKVNRSSELSGREFDIFQAPLTIARWLESEHGVAGLFGRMLSVMNAYHANKANNGLPPMEQIVFQAIYDLLRKGDRQDGLLSTSDIANQIRSVCQRLDITDEQLTNIDVQRIGILLGRLGFEKSRSHGRQRTWNISLPKLTHRAKVAGVVLEEWSDDPSLATWLSPLGSTASPKAKKVTPF